MSAPTRIQRKRTKGWRMPEGAIYVGRPTRWGNPFSVDSGWIIWIAVGLGYLANAQGRRAAAVALHHAWLTDGPIAPGPYADDTSGGALVFADGEIVSVGEQVRGIAFGAAALSTPPTLGARPDLSSLRGHDLACWCPLDQSCHADVLLALANR